MPKQMLNSPIVVTPNRQNIVWYGTTYTDNTGSNSTTNYNQLFKNYAQDWVDCQNFVSQALWYGFGGQNNDPNPHDFWADSSSTDSNWMWTGTSYFENYVIDNYNNWKQGIQAVEGSLSLTEIGDYIYTPGHVLLVTKIIDYDGDGYTDWNEIYVSAHTANRKTGP